MFKRISGEQNLEYFPKVASTDISNGALLYSDGSGNVQPADATSGDHVGVSVREVASEDSDYGDNSHIPVDVPGPKDVFEVDVETGTLSASDVGSRYDLASATGIDVTAQSKQVVTVVAMKDASTALVKVNALITEADVQTT